MRRERPVLSPNGWGAVKFALKAYSLALLYLVVSSPFRMGTDYNRMYESGILMILLVLIVGMVQRKAMLGRSEAVRVGVISGLVGGLLYLFQGNYFIYDPILGKVVMNATILQILVDIFMVGISIALAIGTLVLKRGRRRPSVDVELGTMASLFVGLAIYCAMLLPLFFFLFRFEAEEYLSLVTVFSLPALMLIGILYATCGGIKGEAKTWPVIITSFLAPGFAMTPFLMSMGPMIDPGGEAEIFPYVAFVFGIVGGFAVFLLLLSVFSDITGKFFEDIDRKERYKEKYFKHLGDMKVIGKSPVHRKQGESQEVQGYEE